MLEQRLDVHEFGASLQGYFLIAASARRVNIRRVDADKGARNANGGETKRGPHGPLFETGCQPR